MIKVVSFDFDGTLVQSNEIKAQAFQDVIGRLGEGPRYSQILQTILNLRPGDRTKIFEAFVDNLEESEWANLASSRESLTQRLICDYTERCRSAIIRAEEVSGAVDCLNQLREKSIPTYIVSATPKEALDEIVQGRGWKSLFQKTYGRHAFKPNYLREIVEFEKIAANELVHVGDQIEDARAASEVGCQFIGIAIDARFEDCGVPVIPNLKGFFEVCSKANES